jgi:hypothetical protein
MAVARNACDTGIEIVIWFSSFQACEKTRKGPPGACSGIWQSQKKAQKSPFVYARLTIKPDTMLSHLYEYKEG